MAVLRTFGCQNPRCGAEFDSWEANPACPECGCVRVGWVPKKVAVAFDHAGSAASLDKTLRELTDCFGVTNLRSAREGEAAKVMAVAPAKNDGPPVQFAPGFAAPVGQTAACVPSAQKVDFKVRAEMDRAQAHGKYFSDIGSNTRLEARHDGRRPPQGRPSPAPAKRTGRWA
jgi:hypothetical protein